MNEPFLTATLEEGSTGKVVVCLNGFPEGWEDPFLIGILLADLARHYTLAYDDSLVQSPGKEKLLERIREGFEAEMDNPTSEVTRVEPS